MALIPMKPVLDVAKANSIAFGAFNVNTPNQAKAAIEIHELFRTAAILQVIDFAHGFVGGRADYLNATFEEKIKGAEIMAKKVREYAEEASIPVVLHLDHGKDPEFVKACVDLGYTSVMIDGSHLSFDENVELTSEIVKYAHARGVTVEGELGTLGGREDNVVAKGSIYTNPNKVCEFFKRTGVDCLAISYGTSHGPAKGQNPCIRKEIAIASYENMMHENVDGVLVSHGSSSVPPYLIEDINAYGGKLTNVNGIKIEQVKEVIPYGIGKVNIGTDLRIAILRYIRAYFYKNPEKQSILELKDVWETLKAKPEVIDCRAYLKSMQSSLISGIPANEIEAEIFREMEKGVKEIIGQFIVEFGQTGFADKVNPLTLDEMAKIYK
ncbi:MAG: class II fructose-bisphosphate aldolase [Clostridium sp.]|nr:class II fructose-bisphosphate aldolase [Clostridium sp.]